MQLVQQAFRNLNLRRMMSYYAVACGREIGVFDSWAKCERQVKGFNGAKYKKFPTKEAAKSFINDVQSTGGATQTHSSLAEATKYHRSAQKRKAPADVFWPESKKDKASESTEISEEEMVRLNALLDLKFILKPYNNLKLRITLEVEKQMCSTKSTANTKPKKAASTGRINPGRNVFKHFSRIWSPVGVQSIGGYEFKIDEEGFVICYTDGSCINNGQKGAHAGYGVYFADDHTLNTAAPVTGRATNNVGEIQAAIYAIKTAIRIGIPKLCVSTDSQFLLNAVISWIPGWKANNWLLKNGTAVKNATEFKELDKLLQNNNLTVKWNYVKAHVGIPGNEMADKLARTGAHLYQLKLKNH